MSSGSAGWCEGMLVFVGGWLNLGGSRRDLIHVSQVVESGVEDWVGSRQWPVDRSADRDWGSYGWDKSELDVRPNRSPPSPTCMTTFHGRDSSQVNCPQEVSLAKKAGTARWKQSPPSVLAVGPRLRYPAGSA